AAPSQIVVIDPSVANYESLLKNLRAMPPAQVESPSGPRASAEPAADLQAGTMSIETPVAPLLSQPGTATVQARDDMLVVVLDANWDGVEQITQMLAVYQGLAAVQIISHGTSGALRLGNGT